MTFQPGESGPKVVEFELIDDDDVEPTESFTVSLSSSSRATLGGPSTVNIQDDDGNNSLKSMHNSRNFLLEDVLFVILIVFINIS